MNVKICKVCGKVGLDQMDFNIVYSKANGRYYYGVMCRKCSNKKLTTGVRGRPAGYVVGHSSKEKTSNTRAGYEHAPETKDKISAGLLRYFKKLNPLSDELFSRYEKLDVDGEIARFITANKEEIDNFDDVKTEKRLGTMRYYEYSLREWDITNVGDTITPELLMILREIIEGEE